VVCATKFILRHESPRWQLLHGRERQCLDMLHRIQKSGLPTPDSAVDSLPQRLCISVDQGDDGEPGDDSTASSKKLTFRDRCKQLSHPSLWKLHLVGTSVAFCLNFGAKGLETWSGIYVERIGLPHLSRGIYFTTLTGKVVGDFLNIYASEAVGRIRLLQVAFFVSGISLFLFVISSTSVMLLSLSFICGIGTDILWCCIYMYLTEIYPTSVRSTAFGLAMGLGRSGGVVSSGMGDAFSSIQIPFRLYALSFIIGGVLVSMFTVETAHRPLSDTIGRDDDDKV